MLARGDGAALGALFARARGARAPGLPAGAEATMSISASGQRAAEFLDIGPIARMSGTLRLPGSKSISNRSLLLAALARGTTELTGLLDADDVDRMRESLRTLGVRIEAGAAGETAIVHGVAGAFPVRRASLFLGNAGTAFRPLTAALALVAWRLRVVRRAAHARAADRRSGRCAARARGRHSLHRRRRLSAADDRSGRGARRRQGRDSRQRIEPVRDGAADGAAARRWRCDGRGAGRADLQPLRRHDADADASLRRRRRARAAAICSGCLPARRT